jgi:hypothetical protein
MNSKILLGFLGGVLAATGVYYVQSHRNTSIAATTPTAVAVAPVAAPAPVPAAAIPEATPVPARPPAKKKAVAAEKPAVRVAAPVIQPAPVEQAKVETPPAPEPPRVAASVVAPAPPPPPVEARPEPPQPRSVTIASGTLVTVRLGETVSTERSRPGDSFSATLDQPLVVDGLVVAEKGARATGRIVDAVEAGRVKGQAHLSLELASLMSSDGQKIEFRTARFEKEGPASKTEDAGKIGIGAALGAAIGAIAGGGKGAAIGAATGGAAGGGVVAATRGKPAVLTAETRISFRVDQPVTITERR